MAAIAARVPARDARADATGSMARSLLDRSLAGSAAKPTRRAAASSRVHRRIDSMDDRARKPADLLEAPKPEERDLIDRAAKTRGKNRTDFILDAARQAAEDALLDRTVFTVSPEAYAEFLARLDAPAQSNERLRRVMQTPAPWDHA